MSDVPATTETAVRVVTPDFWQNRRANGTITGGVGRYSSNKAKLLRAAIRDSSSPEEVLEFMGIAKEIARDTRVDPKTRLQAIDMIFDRTIGKPDQQANQEQLEIIQEETELLRNMKEAALVAKAIHSTADQSGPRRIAGGDPQDPSADPVAGPEPV